MMQPKTTKYDEHTLQYFDEGELKFVGTSLIPVLGSEWAAEQEVTEGKLLSPNDIVGHSDKYFVFKDWVRETFGEE